MSLLLLSIALGAPAPFERPARPLPTSYDEQTVLEVPNRRLLLDVEDETRSDNLKELRLYYSADRGRTWHLADTVSPGQTTMRFDAPGDGLYFLKLRFLQKDGKGREQVAEKKIRVRRSK